MFMMGSDDTKTIRVEAGELGSFDTKCVNSMVEVTGKLVEQRVDEAYLQKWEAQLSRRQRRQWRRGSRLRFREKSTGRDWQHARRTHRRLPG